MGLSAGRALSPDGARPRPGSLVSGGPASLDEGEKAFAAHAAALTAKNGRILALVLSAADLAWWPLDRVMGRPAATLAVFDRWRASALVLMVLYLLADLAGVVRRFPMATFSVVTLVGSALMGGCLGRLGNTQYPYFFYLYSVLGVPVIAMLPLRRRGLLTAAMVATLFASFFLLHPANLASPFLRPSLSYMVFSAIVAVAVSHIVYTLTRTNFLQGRALAELNERLEDRVHEQTDELRRLSRHLQTVIEDERGRISRELHDELGQELTAARVALSFARTRFAQEPTAIGGNLEDLDLLLARSSQTARTIVTELRPRILDDLGLLAAAEWLLSRTGERSGLTCHLTRPAGEPAIPKDVSTAAFRILQEALTNVMRHARASSVDVTVSLDGQALELSIADDGVGLPDGEIRGGAGTVGMRERARALGGKLVVAPRPDRGTEVRARLPLDRPSESSAP